MIRTHRLRPRRSASPIRRLLHSLAVVAGGAALTLAHFLVLPLIQAINRPPRPDLMLHAADTAAVPPPPPPMEEEDPEPEPEEEEQELELAEETPSMDLSQLELALDPGMGDGWGASSFSFDLKALASGRETVDGLFALGDLDQEPAATFRANPSLDAEAKRHTPGTVWILATVNELGRIAEAKVQEATHATLREPALTAFKKWRFEPGKRNGQPVKFKIRQRIVFEKMR